MKSVKNAVFAKLVNSVGHDIGFPVKSALDKKIVATIYECDDWGTAI
jgi:hypothetical protein